MTDRGPVADFALPAAPTMPRVVRVVNLRQPSQWFDCRPEDACALAQQRGWKEWSVE